MPIRQDLFLRKTEMGTVVQSLSIRKESTLKGRTISEDLSQRSTPPNKALSNA
jgi:hypothetical protein